MKSCGGGRKAIVCVVVCVSVTWGATGDAPGCGSGGYPKGPVNVGAAGGIGRAPGCGGGGAEASYCDVELGGAYVVRVGDGYGWSMKGSSSGAAVFGVTPSACSGRFA
jgi:hypothetical protein